MKKLLILGAGEFAKLVAWTAENAGWELSGFVVDDEFYHQGQRHAGHWVYSVSSVAGWGHIREFVIVSGTVHVERRALAEQLTANEFESAAVCHPTAWIHEGTIIKPGAFVNAGAIIDMGTSIGSHAIINRGAMLGHHVGIGLCTTVGPGAVLCGKVEIGSQAMIGAGATIREGVIVGDGATVGMGAVLLRNVPAGETWWGNPAQRVR